MTLCLIIGACAASWGQEPVWIREPVAEARGQDADTDSDELTSDSSLHDFLAFAMRHNDGLRAAFSRWEAAMQRIPQAQALPDPMLAYAYYVREVETRVGPQEQRLSLSQRFPWFGKLRLRGDIAALNAETAWIDFQAQRLDLLARVSRLYYDYYYLMRAIEVTQENFDLLRGLEIVARERYRTGSPMTPVTQAQVELGKLEDRLQSLRELRPALSARLSAALNRQSEEVLPWPADLPADLPPVDRTKVLETVSNGNPSLLRLGILAEREASAAELAALDRWPDITLGVSAIDTDDALMSGVSDSGKDPVMVSVALNLPIWYNKYRAAEREAQIRREGFLHERSDRRENVLAQAKMLLYEFEDAERKISLYRDTLIPKAKQNFSVAQQAFQAGTSDFQAVIDAERALLDFELAYERARVARGKNYADIMALSGVGLVKDMNPD